MLAGLDVVLGGASSTNPPRFDRVDLHPIAGEAVPPTILIPMYSHNAGRRVAGVRIGAGRTQFLSAVHGARLPLCKSDPPPHITGSVGQQDADDYQQERHRQ